MPTFTITQYQQVQNVMSQLVQLMQQAELWQANNVQQQLTAAYAAMTVISTYMADLGTG